MMHANALLKRLGAPMRALLCFVLLGMQTALAQAPDYPRHPIRFMVGFAPGGSADLVSRLLAQKLTERLGQPVVAEQKMGATGILANQVVVSAPPDGHTMVLLTGGHAVSAVLMQSLPYDSVRDFAMVSTVTGYPMVIAVSPDSNYKTLRGFLDYAHAHPGQVTYAVSGIGSLHYMLGELINIEAGTEIVSVPLKGASQSLVEVLSGRIDAMIETATASFAPIRGGRLRALALSAPVRYALMPDVPTIAETLPGVEAMSWLGLAVTPGTPQPIIDRLNREVRAILQEPDVQERLAVLGGVPLPSSPAEMRQRVEREIALWQRVADAKRMAKQ